MSDVDFSEILGIKKLSNNLNEARKIKSMRDGKGCILCDYTGYTTNDNGKDIMCSCEKDKFLKELYIKANVPRVHILKTLDDWDTRNDSKGRELGAQQITSEHVHNFLKFYEKNLIKISNGYFPSFTHTGNVKSKVCSLVFEGQNGSGKTFIAAVLVQSAIKSNLTAKYYDWSDIISCATDYEKKEEFEKIIDDFKHTDFIAIDGIEHYNYTHPQFPQQLDRLAKTRLNSGKPIVFMSFGSMNFSTTSGWTSLIDGCLKLRLPYIK